jgi:hypothetical protein
MDFAQRIALPVAPPLATELASPEECLEALCGNCQLAAQAAAYRRKAGEKIGQMQLLRASLEAIRLQTQRSVVYFRRYLSPFS